MKLSRRDFVKLWGVSTAPAGLSGLGGGQALATPDEAPARPGGREILPIPDIQQPYPTAMYGKDVPPQSAQPLRPPEGAPNVVIILIDDMGFGASSAFGGPIHMPTLERVAAEGLKYNRFHTPGLVDHAIAWVQAQQTLTPDRPFFVYLSLGTTHALRWKSQVGPASKFLISGLDDTLSTQHGPEHGHHRRRKHLGAVLLISA